MNGTGSDAPVIAVTDSSESVGFQTKILAFFITVLLFVAGLAGLLAFEHPTDRIKYIAVIPACAGGIALLLSLSHWPELVIHLCLIGVILDQWEGLSFTGLPFLTFTKILFLSAFGLLLLRDFIAPERKKPWNLPTIALAHLPFSIICLGSTVAFAYSLKSSLRWCIAPLTLPILSIVLAQFIHEQKQSIRLLKAFALYSFFPMLVALLESLINRRITGGMNFVLYGIDDIFRVAGNFENPNDFVVLMLFSVPVLLCWAVLVPSWWAKCLLLGGCVFELLILVKTYSRSGYISMAFTLFALALLSKGRLRKVSWAVCLAGMVIFVSLPETRDRLMTLAGIRTEGPGVSQALASLSFRKQLFQIAWWEFLENPVMGVGFGNIGARAKTYSSMLNTKSTAENTYIEILAEMGLIGFSAFLFFLYMAWKAMWTGLQRCRGNPGVEALFCGLAAGYCGFAFNSLFDTNIPDNLPWILLPVMAYLGTSGKTA